MQNKIIRFIMTFVVCMISFFAIYYVSLLVSGMLLTVLHVPDIETMNNAGEAMSSEVTFGDFIVGPWWANPFYIFAILASIAVSLYIVRLKEKASQ